MSPQQRVVLGLLSDDWIELGDVAEAYRTKENATGDVWVKVTRLLWMLREASYVERHPDGRYRLATRGGPPARRARVAPKAAKHPTKKRQPKRTPKPKPKAKRKRLPDQNTRTTSTIRTVPFFKMYDGTGKRYGQLFYIVRVLLCALCKRGYRGAGHPECGLGAQGGHTAHHVGRFDREGLIPGCGAAHDLYAGLGGEATIREFRGWLLRNGLTLEGLGQEYVEKAKKIAGGGKYDDAELARY